MVIIMNPDAKAADIKGVIEAIQSVGLEAKVMEGTQQKGKIVLTYTSEEELQRLWDLLAERPEG